MDIFKKKPINRIAVLSVHTCPLAMLGGKKTGGMNVYVRDFCRELAGRGVHVDVFTRSQDSCVPQVVHELGETGRVIHIKAGPEEPLPVPEVANHLDKFVSGVVAFAASEGITYDLIHSHYWLSGLVAGRLQTFWGDLPVVQMFHTLGHMKNQIASDDSHRAPQARIDGEMKVIHDIADRVIAATPAEEAQLIELYGADPTRIAIVPPGVDLERFATISAKRAKCCVGLDRDGQNILFVGRIEPLKGIDTLLQAINILRERSPHVLNNVSVTIVGGDPNADTLDAEMARLQTMREKLGLGELVTFVGSKDQMMLPYYYAASEIVVMPSHYESFGLVALEAMAMGTPVIASEVGGLAHLIQDGVTGYHVPSRDPLAMAQKIFALLNDSVAQWQMGMSARAYAKKYAWAHIVDTCWEIYQSLLWERTEAVDLLPHTLFATEFSFQPPSSMPFAA